MASLGLGLRSTLFTVSVAVLPDDILMVLMGEVAMVNEERRLRIRRGGGMLICKGKGGSPANDDDS